MAEFGNVLFAETDLDVVLQRIADVVVDSLDACEASSVAAVDPVTGKLLTRARTDDRVEILDDVQYGHSEGPCVEAIRTGDERVVDLEGNENRWPHFVATARDLGFECVVALPLRSGDETVGSLNLFATSRAAFREADLELARELASAAAATVANAVAFQRLRRLSEQFDEALTSRTVIDLAKGILMEREGVTADGAFDLLREVSQRENRKLREVAQLIVRSTPVSRGGS